MTHILFWKKQREQALKMTIMRLEHNLLTGHPEYKLKMPQEVKDAQSKGKIPQRCIDKLTQEHLAYIRRVHTPTIQRPERLTHG